MIPAHLVDPGQVGLFIVPCSGRHQEDHYCAENQAKNQKELGWGLN